jgi:regulator of replication initiation timing
MHKLFIVIFIIIVFSGCTTTGAALRETRNTVIQLEQLNAERSVRIAELEKLYDAEAEGNTALRRVLKEQQSTLDKYIKSERYRIEQEKRIADNLSEIFGEGAAIIEEILDGYKKIREYFESQEFLE